MTRNHTTGSRIFTEASGKFAVSANGVKGTKRKSAWSRPTGITFRNVDGDSVGQVRLCDGLSGAGKFDADHQDAVSRPRQ